MIKLQGEKCVPSFLLVLVLIHPPRLPHPPQNTLTHLKSLFVLSHLCKLHKTKSYYFCSTSRISQTHIHIYICANSKHIYPWILLLFVSLTGSNKMVTGSDLSPVIMIFCDILHPCQFSINYRPWKTCCLIKTNCLDREGQGNLFIIW